VRSCFSTNLFCSLDHTCNSRIHLSVGAARAQTFTIQNLVSQQSCQRIRYHFTPAAAKARSIKPLSSSLRTKVRSTISSSLISPTARVAAQHQALNVAHSFEGGMRLFFEPAAGQ
jgi:hypothetical protein